MRYGWGLRESGHQGFKVRSQDEVSVMGIRKRVFKNELLQVKEGKVELRWKCQGNMNVSTWRCDPPK